MTLSSLLARALAALTQPRLGVAFVSSCAITAAVAGPMAYQATHYKAPQRAAEPRVQIVEPTRHGSRPTTTTSTSTTSTSTSTSLPGSTTSSSPATSTTAGPATTLGPTTTQAAPRLHTQVSPAGSLIAARRGAVAVRVSADTAAASHVTLTITATGATPVAAPNEGWTCAGGPVLTCTDTGTLVPGTDETVYVALDVAATAMGVRVDAVASAPGSAPSADAEAVQQAAVSSGVSARFAGVVRGNISTIGNTLSTCPSGATAGSSTCEQARARAASVGLGQDDNDWSMVSIDADADAATSNSSAAVLGDPGGRVLFAGLYWSGQQAAGAGGTPAAGAVGSALFATPATSGGQAPNASGYVPVTATQVDQSGATYQAFADVTSLVQAGGGGRYWLGGVAAATGTNTEAGWSLTVVVRQPTAPERSLLVFDGLLDVKTGSATLDMSGFRVAAGTNAQLGLVAYEGDWGLQTDAVTCGSATSALSDSTRQADNFFNSSITRAGAIDASGTPAQPNTFGLDIATVDVSPAAVPGCLTPGSSSTTLQFSTVDDVYLVGVVTMSVSR